MKIEICKPYLSEYQIHLMIQYLEAVKDEITIREFKDCITFLIADLKFELKKLDERK